jgi:MFS family permease
VLRWKKIMQSKDPKSIIDHGPMSVGQWVAVLVTVGLNAMDGIDVLSISFASPGIAKDWGVGKATLGWILSMELVGMGLGSVLLGGVADKIGRRPTILACLLAMTVGMLGAGHAGGVPALLVWRLLTGLGIGGMLASINATAAELSNQRWRSLAVGIMVIGYPLGGVIGGMVVQRLLAGGTWHDVFVFGGCVTAAFIPLVWFLVPESVDFLDRMRKPGALERINRILTRFGHESILALTEGTVESDKRSVMDIFKPGLIVTTVLVTLGYFAHVTSF